MTEMQRTNPFILSEAPSDKYGLGSLSLPQSLNGIFRACWRLRLLVGCFKVLMQVHRACCWTLRPFPWSFGRWRLGINNSLKTILQSWSHFFAIINESYFKNSQNLELKNILMKQKLWPTFQLSPNVSLCNHFVDQERSFRFFAWFTDLVFMSNEDSDFF